MRLQNRRYRGKRVKGGMGAGGVAAVFVIFVLLMLALTMNATARDQGIPVSSQLRAVFTTGDLATPAEIRAALDGREGT